MGNAVCLADGWPNGIVHANVGLVTIGSPDLLRLDRGHNQAKSDQRVIWVYRKAGAIFGANSCVANGREHQPKNMSNCHKIKQMTTKYTKWFHPQNLPKLGVWKYIVWQPWLWLTLKTRLKCDVLSFALIEEFVLTLGVTENDAFFCLGRWSPTEKKYGPEFDSILKCLSLWIN
jgi:hypothetical protein